MKNSEFINNKGFIFFTGALLLVIGLVFSIYTKRYISVDRSDITRSRKLKELVSLLKETKSKNYILNNQLVDLKKQIDTIKDKGLSVNLASSRMKKIYAAAGFTSIEGKGLHITINDNAKINDGSVNFDTLLSSEDLLQLINVLKASDAKAIAVNDQRIVTTSEVVTAGSSIVINKTKLTPPYIIKVIGPVDMMSSALQMRGGIVEYLSVFGISINIRKEDELAIPAYREEKED